MLQWQRLQQNFALSTHSQTHKDSHTRTHTYTDTCPTPSHTHVASNNLALAAPQLQHCKLCSRLPLSFSLFLTLEGHAQQQLCRGSRSSSGGGGRGSGKTRAHKVNAQWAKALLLPPLLLLALLATSSAMQTNTHKYAHAHTLIHAHRRTAHSAICSRTLSMQNSARTTTTTAIRTAAAKAATTAA